MTPHAFESFRLEQDDDSHVLNTFFAQGALMSGETLDWSGSWHIKRPLMIPGGAHHVCGSLRVSGGPPMSAAVVVRAKGSVFNGTLHVKGPGHVAGHPGDRSLVNGVYLESAESCMFDRIEVESVVHSAVVAPHDSKVIDCQIRMLVARDAGSAPFRETTCFNYRVSDRSDEGGDTSVTQRTWLELAEPHVIERGNLVLVDGLPYIVTSAGPSGIEVFPKVLRMGIPHKVLSSHGAALDLRSRDSTGFTVGRISAMRCGAALRVASLYGPVVHGITAQFCGTGIQWGAAREAAILGGLLGSLHLEACNFDGIKCNTLNKPVTVGDLVVGFSQSKWVKLAPGAVEQPDRPAPWKEHNGLFISNRPNP